MQSRTANQYILQCLYQQREGNGIKTQKAKSITDEVREEKRKHNNMMNGLLTPNEVEVLNK